MEDARPYRLTRDEELTVGLTRVVAGRAEAALERLREAGAGEIETGVAIHGARKDMRKRAKDLWYELRLLSGSWPVPLKATVDEAHRLSELLGDHHDLAVLREDLRERNLGAEETQALSAAIDRHQAELAAGAISLGRRLYAERPQDFERRLRRYWEAWRG